VIVTQVALTATFPATAYFVRDAVVRLRSADAGFAADQYVSASLEMDAEFVRGPDKVIRAVFPDARYRAASQELARRLSAEPSVAGVTFADRLPRTYYPAQRIELGRDRPQLAGGDDARHRVGVAWVSLDFFDVLGARIGAGRAFNARDVDPQARTVIVNASFVRNIAGGRNVIGLRMRELSRDQDNPAPGPWLEIVGVAPDLGMIAGDSGETAGYYRPAPPGAVRPNHLIVHVKGDPVPGVARVQALAVAVDPTLRLHDVAPMREVDPTQWMEIDFLSKLLTLVSAMALLLSLASIYAAMSFEVSRRTREIGIRVALGADAGRVAAVTFSRPLSHVAFGVSLGAALTAALAMPIRGGLSAADAGLVAAYAAMMLCVCLLPSIGHVRRALRVDPSETLRAESA
jgi:hypothetical protein